MSVIESKPRPRRRRTISPAHLEQAAETASLPANFRRKAFFDRLCAGLLLAPGLPLIALLVLLTRLTSRGPGIYRQLRVGRDGRKFMMYKIRTMRHDAEARSGPVWAQTNRDPRITLLGRALRKFHLDELPQLLNVLKGEMSLVGPRPERPEFVHILAESIPDYRDRLVAPPGITGLAQLNLPPDSDLNSVRRKLVLDRQYVRRAGLWLDTRIILCTGLRISKFPERWLLPLFGLRRSVALPEIPDGGPSSGDGNGNGNGDRSSDRRSATPAYILQQAAAEPGDGDGGPARQRDDPSADHVPLKPR